MQLSASQHTRTTDRPEPKEPKPGRRSDYRGPSIAQSWVLRLTYKSLESEKEPFHVECERGFDVKDAFCGVVLERVLVVVVGKQTRSST